MTAFEGQGQFAGWSEADVRTWIGTFDFQRLLYSSPYRSVPVVERFDWDGHPVDPGFHRVRVMGRQAYVLCHAALGGDGRLRHLASVAVEALISQGLGDNSQFRVRLGSDGSVIDDVADLYDVAFGLFAMAWWYRLSGDERAIAVAERSVAHLRAEMACPSGAGFLSRAGDTMRREQNPHMHLFEAATFLTAFTRNPLFAALSDDLFSLAETALFDAESGTLPEFFDSSWRPCDADGYVRVEPGHHYEWVWLLHRYARLAQQPRAYAIADRLFAFARTYGHDEETGLVLDAVDRDGSAIETNFRIWPNTEYLKAQVAMQEHHGQGAGFDDLAIRRNVQRIRDFFLTRQVDGPAAALREGWWIDHLHGQGLRPLSNHVPASTLYHIFFAFSELLRHRAGHDPFSGRPW